MNEATSEASSEVNIEKKIEEIHDGKNGVVCWFYVYKMDALNKQSICGIVIIKQLTDIINDESESSSVTDNKIFFYAETNIKENMVDSHSLSYKYDNDDLIKSFIATEPNNAAIEQFNSNNIQKCISGDYIELPRFLNDLIKKNFEMFENSKDDKSIRLYYSSVSDSISESE